jgi:hypothetical protein
MLLGNVAQKLTKDFAVFVVLAGRRGRMVAGFKTTYAISADHL